MTSPPPGPAPGMPQPGIRQTGMMPGQPGLPGGQSPAPTWRVAIRQIGWRRTLCGIAWAILTIILIAGGIGELTIGVVGGAVLCFVLGICTGWYDYRVWTFKARRLWFIF